MSDLKVLTMNLEIDFEPDNEELTIVLDDASLLKASLDNEGELTLNRAFSELEDENPDLYAMLMNIARELFKFTE